MRILRGLVAVLVASGCVNDVSSQESRPIDTFDNVDVQGLYDCTARADTGYRSGDSFSIEVVQVDGKPVETNTANAYIAMQSAAAADGVNIRIVSGFRTNAQQEYLYGCYVNCNCNNCNLAASPGYSNHQSGHALDLNTSDAGVYSWLVNHGDEFGFSATVPSEDWHWEWWGDEDDFDGPCGFDADTDEAVFGAAMFDAPGNADLDGDGAADVCARANAGVVCSVSGGDAPFALPVSTTLLASENGWDDQTNFATVRLGDITGDGRADLCARANNGVVCYPSTGTGFGARIDGPAWADAQGWALPEYYSTMRVVDVNADGFADLCARAAAGFRCALSTGAAFGETVVGTFFSNDDGFASPDKYGTIRMADVDGDGMLDACARGAAGIECHRFVGDAWGATITGPAWSDAQGFTHVKHWSTLRFADLDGDGRDDACIRAINGMHCALSTGAGFNDTIRGPLTDDNGWADDDNYATIRLGDVTGDGRADLCARANANAVCFPSIDGGFGPAIAGPAFFADGAGFTERESYRTFRLADVDGDGKHDVCGRDSAGFSCFAATGEGFGARIDGPRWSDANGWKQMQYAGTIMTSGVTPPAIVPEDPEEPTPEEPTPEEPTPEEPTPEPKPGDPDVSGDPGDVDDERMTPANLPSSVSTGCASTPPATIAWLALALVFRRRRAHRS